MSRLASAMTYPNLTHESFCRTAEPPRPIDEGFRLSDGLRVRRRCEDRPGENLTNHLDVHPALRLIPARRPV